jgi:hypothetical protein
MLAILPVCFRAMSAISLWSERYVLFCIQYWTQNTTKQASNTILTQKIRLHIEYWVQATAYTTDAGARSVGVQID